MYVIYCTYMIQVEAKPPSDLSTLEENIFKVYIFHCQSERMYCTTQYSSYTALISDPVGGLLHTLPSVALLSYVCGISNIAIL